MNKYVFISLIVILIILIILFVYLKTKPADSKKLEVVLNQADDVHGFNSGILASLNNYIGMYNGYVRDQIEPDKQTEIRDKFMKSKMYKDTIQQNENIQIVLNELNALTPHIGEDSTYAVMVNDKIKQLTIDQANNQDEVNKILGILSQ